MVTQLEAVEDGPSPTELMAETRKTYVAEGESRSNSYRVCGGASFTKVSQASSRMRLASQDGGGVGAGFGEALTSGTLSF